MCETVSGKPSVLFVCVHNAGRSQMAAAFLTHLSACRVEVRGGRWAARPADLNGLGGAEGPGASTHVR
ncbi:hypothetical protein ACFV2U_32985, partial [Streptomyces sp. NPDC059697]